MGKLILKKSFFVNVAFIILVIAYTFPNSEVIRIFNIPIVRFADLLLMMASILYFSRLNKENKSTKLIVFIIIVISSINGLTNMNNEYFDWNFFILDFAFYLAIILGLVVAENITPVKIIKLLYYAFFISAISLLISIILLKLGLLISSQGESRLVVLPMYYSAFFVYSLAPVLFFYFKNSNKKRVFIIFSLMLCFVFSFSSATRNILILSITSSLFLILGLYRSLSFSKFFFLLITFAILSSLLYYFSFLHIHSTLFNRFHNENIDNESRYEEIVLLFKGFNQIILGKGFGVGGLKPGMLLKIVDSPHIAIFTYLYKSGIVFFLIIIFFIIKTFMLVLKKNNSNWICGTYIIILFLQHCISGGYTFPYLFIAGIFIFFTNAKKTVFTRM